LKHGAVIQYFSKVVLLVYLAKPDVKKSHPNTHARVSSLVSAFSSARKIIRLGHFVEPYSQLREVMYPAATVSRPLSSWKLDNALAFVNASLSILNDFSDDVVCLAKIGVMNKEVGKRFEPISNALWFTCICLDIRSLVLDIHSSRDKMRKINTSKDLDAAEKRMQSDAASQKLGLQWISLLKLSGDFCFCTYDVWGCQFSDLFQAQCGFISAVCASYKLWYKALPK
jgi:hypothetical protein